MNGAGRPVVCLTVDVEDWYEGMAALGHPIARPADARTGVGGLLSALEGQSGSTVTAFCVGSYLPMVRSEVLELAGAGHEVASHGPDHGRLPTGDRALVEWMRRGREQLEDLLGAAVRGFRSPRFEVPAGMSLRKHRELVAEAGFDYVSDTHFVGQGSAVRELPVLVERHVPVGGGSFQRFLPPGVVDRSLRRVPVAVCYYHSYDFGATLPPWQSIRSVREASQLLGRNRVLHSFVRLLNTYGSEACLHVTSSV